MSREIVKRIQKSEDEEILISRIGYRGLHFVDVRLFWKRSENESLPTRKGVVIPMKLVKEVIKGLKRA